MDRDTSRRKHLSVELRPLLRRGQRCAFCLAILLCTAAAGFGSNPIQLENANLGTTDWQLTNPATASEIAGYASATSVNRGGQIKFFVSTVDANLTFEIFRMGWYNGTGGRRMTSPTTMTGQLQVTPPPDPTTGMVDCNWQNPIVFTVPTNATDPTVWTSGYYLVKLTSASGKQAYIIFVVRDDARNSDYFMVATRATAQAYNGWGGKSLYPFNSTGGVQATKVSFNRPYDIADGQGTGRFLEAWEYNMVRFLEREGYDVSYLTDVDLDGVPNLLLNHRLGMVVGHGEYVSWQMRKNISTALGDGIAVSFFSGNDIYWQIRFENSPATGDPKRVIVAYKETALTADPYATDGDPTNDYLITTNWRSSPINMPEDALIGTMYDFGSNNVAGDITITNSSTWVTTNTGLTNGSVLTGLQGHEADREQGGQPANTVVVAHSPYTCGCVNGTGTRYSDMTYYTAPSGSTVFATGTMQWSWGLDDWTGFGGHPVYTNAGAQQMTRNVLARTGARAPIYLVQSNFVVRASASLTLKQSFPGRTTSGNLTVVAMGWDSSADQTLVSLTDSQNNLYLPAIVMGNNVIYYAKNIVGGATTVTATFSGATTGLMYIHEYAGADPVFPLDQASSQTGTGAAVTSGSKSTSQATELIFGYAGVDHHVTAPGAGFTVRETAGGNMSEDTLVTVAGSYAATFTQSITGGWTGLMATFRAAGSASPPPIQVVQSTNIVNFSTNSSSLSKAFVTSNTAGDLIVVAASGGAAIALVSDTLGNTYSLATSSAAGTDTIYYAKNIRAGTNTVVVTFASATMGLMYIHEYAGLDTAAPLDQVSAQSGTGTAVTSGSKSITQTPELIFGYATVDFRVSAPGPGFTVRETAGGNMSEDMVATSTGSYAATFTQSKSGEWAGLMATFTAAGTGAPPPALGISFVQSANAVNFSSNAPTLAKAFSAGNTAGNTIIVGISGGVGVSSVTDTQGNVYSLAVQSAGATDFIYYSKNVKAGPNTVTANFTVPTMGLMYIHEYSGLAAVAPLDQTSSQSGNGTAINSGARTTTSATELVFGYGAVAQRVSAAGVGSTPRETAAGNMSEDMVVSSIGAYSASFTQSISGSWSALMATFKIGP